LNAIIIIVIIIVVVIIIIIIIIIIINNASVKVNVSRDRPRWPKGFLVG